MCTNIIKIIKVYEDLNNLYLLLELKEGGDLHELISSTMGLEEDDSKIIIAQILLSADFFH